jgi:FAD/FMN-containing dehydrogenase
MNDRNDGLASIVGRDNIVDDPGSLEEYSADHSFTTPRLPRCIVRPGDEEQVRALVAWANETGTPLVPVSSGGPHFHGDTVASVPGAAIVELTRLDAIRRIDRRNRMVVVEPGVTYGRLQPRLAEQGMRVTPPLLPRVNKSVVAGLLERQPTLIPRYNYALPEPLRDCGVVWGSGEVMSTGEAGGGPLSLEDQWRTGALQIEPKGPAQTDFYRLLTGAQGTMGIVTWASLKCELLPEARGLLLVPAAALDDVVEFVYRLTRVRLGDEVLLVSDSYLARLLAADTADAGARRAELPAWTVVVGLGGRELFAQERVGVQESDVRELARDAGVELRSAVSGAASGELVAALEGLSGEPHWKLRDKGGCADVFFLTTLDKAPGYVATARQVALAAGFAASDLGVYLQPQHQGVSWHVELSLPYDPGDGDETRRAREFFATVSERLIAAGAYFSRPHGAWADLVYERDPVARDVLRKVKAIFDPRGVMNPGKLCFAAAGREEAHHGA